MSVRSKLSDAIRQIRAMFGPETPEDIPGQTVREGDIAAALIALGAKMAKADGQVTPDEIEAFSEVFHANRRAQPGVARLFNLFRRTTLGFEAYAGRVAHRWRAYPAVLEDVLEDAHTAAVAARKAAEDAEAKAASRTATASSRSAPPRRPSTPGRASTGGTSPHWHLRRVSPTSRSSRMR